MKTEKYQGTPDVNLVKHRPKSATEGLNSTKLAIILFSEVFLVSLMMSRCADTHLPNTYFWQNRDSKAMGE